jgi:hypothetical protein
VPNPLKVSIWALLLVSEIAAAQPVPLLDLPKPIDRNYEFYAALDQKVQATPALFDQQMSVEDQQTFAKIYRFARTESGTAPTYSDSLALAEAYTAAFFDPIPGSITSTPAECRDIRWALFYSRADSGFQPSTRVDRAFAPARYRIDCTCPSGVERHLSHNFRTDGAVVDARCPSS